MHNGSPPYKKPIYANTLTATDCVKEVTSSQSEVIHQLERLELATETLNMTISSLETALEHVLHRTHPENECQDAVKEEELVPLANKIRYSVSNTHFCESRIRSLINRLGL